MIDRPRTLAVILLAGASAFSAAACGDDSINPSNPDASAAKDAAGASDAGEAGGEGGAETGSDAGAEGGDAASD